MKVVAILQARMNSTRLPGKMLLPLCGAPLVQRVIERVQRAKKIDEVVLAVPHGDWPLIDLAIDLCKVMNPIVYEEDLVGRYLAAAVFHQADIIVRIPCDNPCVQPEYIDAAVTRYMEGAYTFLTNTTAYVQNVFVDGLGCEVLSVSRLKWLDAATAGNPVWREHPHQWFYDKLVCDEVEADIRLDVNTLEDYLFIKNMYDVLYPTHPNFTIQDILAYLETKKVKA